MKKTENIYVSLQLEKDQTSGDLLLYIQFDRTAPNFFIDKNDINWCPTIEELDFISEAFKMVAKGKRQMQGKIGEYNTREDLLHQADERAILDRVMDKKDRTFR
jgi:hypothetical protein